MSLDNDDKHNHNATDGEAPAGSRRKFLKLMGSASVAAVSLRAQMRGATPPQAKTHSPTALDKVTQADVVVIGGGFAGTSAARECCQAGLRTVLLEARNRLGGRTFYTKFGEDPVEMGGTWIHWFQPNVWSELLHYGLDIDETPGFTSPERIMWLSGDKLVDPPLDQATAMFAEGMKKFNEDAPNIFPRPYDTFFKADLVKKYDGMSVMDRIKQLNLPKEQEDLVIAMQELCASASCNDAAYLDMAKWWALSGNDLWIMNDILARFHFKNGTISLINAMVQDAKIPVFMSTPVSKIKHDTNGVEVTTQSGKVVKAKKAIVAVPLNVIKAIQFEPAVSPLRLEASKQTHAGFGTKLHIRVKGPVPSFWAQAHEPEPLSAIFTESSGQQNSLLIGFGSNPKLLDIHDTAAVEKAVRKFFPSMEVIETFGYDWTLDPYSRGTWCVYRPNMVTKYIQELQKPEGNVFFASSDWANGWRGFIDGGIESGRNTGQKAVKSLRS